MSETPNNQAAEVVISSDEMSATLILPPEDSTSGVTIENCVALLQGKGVDVTVEVKRAVENLVNQHQADPQSKHTGEVALGEAPQPGADGEFEYEPDFDLDALNREDPPESSDSENDEAVDYYNRTTFYQVKKGDTVARLTPPAPGCSGRSVLGDEVPAPPVKPYPLTVDDSINERPDGRLVTCHAGVLSHSDGVLRVLDHLEISQFVDFSTGNIVFDGDVVISKGVRDCFVVEATGSITVRGLVEAATIKAGKNASLSGGMAAREKGSVQIGGDLEARYLDNVDGEIGHSLIVAKEIINSRLAINGDVACERATLVGGRLTVAGVTTLSELGSDAGVLTELVMGSDCEIARSDQQVVALLAKIRACEESLHPEYDPLLKNLQKLTNDQQKRYRALRKTIRSIQELSKKVRIASERLHTAADRCVSVEIIINRVIHPGAKLLLGDFVVDFNQSLAGPLHIQRDRHGELIVKDLRDKSSLSLDTVASVRRLERARDDGEAPAEEPADDSSASVAANG